MIPGSRPRGRRSATARSRTGPSRCGGAGRQPVEELAVPAEEALPSDGVPPDEPPPVEPLSEGAATDCEGLCVDGLSVGSWVGV